MSVRRISNLDLCQRHSRTKGFPNEFYKVGCISFISWVCEERESILTSIINDPVHSIGNYCTVQEISYTDIIKRPAESLKTHENGKKHMDRYPIPNSYFSVGREYPSDLSRGNYKLTASITFKKLSETNVITFVSTPTRDYRSPRKQDHQGFLMKDDPPVENLLDVFPRVCQICRCARARDEQVTLCKVTSLRFFIPAEMSWSPSRTKYMEQYFRIVGRTSL